MKAAQSASDEHRHLVLTGLSAAVEALTKEAAAMPSVQRSRRAAAVARLEMLRKQEIEVRHKEENKAEKEEHDEAAKRVEELKAHAAKEEEWNSAEEAGSARNSDGQVEERRSGSRVRSPKCPQLPKTKTGNSRTEEMAELESILEKPVVLPNGEGETWEVPTDQDALRARLALAAEQAGVSSLKS